MERSTWGYGLRGQVAKSGTSPLKHSGDRCSSDAAVLQGRHFHKDAPRGKLLAVILTDSVIAGIPRLHKQSVGPLQHR